MGRSRSRRDGRPAASADAVARGGRRAVAAIVDRGSKAGRRGGASGLRAARRAGPTGAAGRSRGDRGRARACSSRRSAKACASPPPTSRAVARAELAALERPATAELEQGQRVEVVHAPVAAAGVYAPGGKAAYPSSVLMCCLPAQGGGRGADRGRLAARVRADGRARRCSPRARWPGSTRSTRSAARRRSRRSPSEPRACAAVDVIVGPGQPVRDRGQAPARGAGRDRRARRSQRAAGGGRRAPPIPSGSRSTSAHRPSTATDSLLVVDLARPGACSTGSASGSPSSPPSGRASATATLALVDVARARAVAEPRRRVRARAPRARLQRRRRGGGAGQGRGLRVRRRGRGDGVRRLRRRLQPRAADRRRGALRRPARVRERSCAAPRSSASRRPPREN